MTYQDAILRVGKKQSDYRYPGDYQLENILIMDSSGVGFVLSELMIEVNIFQDMFQPFMKIEIAVNDSAALLNAFGNGVIGGEMIYVSFKTADPNLRLIRLAFLLNSITNRFKTGDGNEQYLIEGFSAEYYSVIDKKISQSFGGTAGKKISEIVDIIYDEYIMTPQIKSVYKFLGDNKMGCDKEYFSAVKSHQTTGLHKCVIPNMSPIQTINYLAKDAVDDDVASKYFFYENFDGFQFRSLGKLVEQEPKYKEYVYYPSTLEKSDNAGDGQKTFFNIVDMERVKDIDMLDNMSQGLFGAKTIELDPLRKKATITKFDYQKEVDRFKKLGDTKIHGGSKSDAIVHLKTSRRGHDTDGVFAKEAPLSSRNVIKDPIRDSYFKHVTHNIIRITVYGNSDLNVGDTVYAEFTPSTSYDVPEGDKYTSGKYLITKVRHKFDKKMYFTIFECVKDSGLIREEVDRTSTKTGLSPDIDGRL